MVRAQAGLDRQQGGLACVWGELALCTQAPHVLRHCVFCNPTFQHTAKSLGAGTLLRETAEPHPWRPPMDQSLRLVTGTVLAEMRAGDFLEVLEDTRHRIKK